MLKGHVQSLQAVMRGKIANPCFDPHEHPDVRANIKAMCTLCGLSPSDVLYVYFDVSPLRPAHAVLIDHAACAVVLTIRGTLSPEDALTDLMASATSDEQFNAVGSFSEASFHIGFLQAAKWMIAQVRPTLETAAQEHPTYRLVVVGHSLGAGIGAIIALALDEGVWLDEPVESSEEIGTISKWLVDPVPLARTKTVQGAGFSHVECYCFACPSVASEEVSTSERATRVVTTVVCGWDMVPRLCARNVDSLLHEVSMTSHVTKTVDAVGSMVGGKVKQYAERRHEQTGCKNVLPVSLAKQSEMSPQHYPIGHCYLIANAQELHASLLCAAPQDFHSIMLNTRMLSDHMLAQYEAGLTKACQSLFSSSASSLDATLTRCVGTTLWQFQRFLVGKGWVATAPGGLLFKKDPPGWTTQAGAATVAPPGDRWVAEIRTTGYGTDAEGWMYSATFEKFLTEDKLQPGKRMALDLVRRRLWVELSSTTEQRGYLAAEQGGYLAAAGSAQEAEYDGTSSLVQGSVTFLQRQCDRKP